MLVCRGAPIGTSDLLRWRRIVFLTLARLASVLLGDIVMLMAAFVDVLTGWLTDADRACVAPIEAIPVPTETRAVLMFGVGLLAQLDVRDGGARSDHALDPADPLWLCGMTSAGLVVSCSS